VFQGNSGEWTSTTDAKDEMERNYGVYKTDLPKNSGFLAIPNIEKTKRFLPQFTLLKINGELCGLALINNKG
jgi:hypothetical protein